MTGNPNTKYKTWAEIDLGALRHNYRTVAAAVHARAPRCRVIGVVKADAYGHDVHLVAPALAAEGCDFFAVSCISEALSLREIVGAHAEVLILGYSMTEDVEALAAHGILQTVFSLDYARELSEEMARLIRAGRLRESAALRVHVKLDTGMNRLGFDAADAPAAAAQIRAVEALPHLSVEGMFTHFATADTDGGRVGRTAVQCARFEAVEAALRADGCCPAFLHLCNSAGALTLPEMYRDGVRAGIVLYGLAPDGSILPQYRPVMRMCTRIAQIHVLRAGESVSYGAAYTAERDMRIATIPVGYGDGLVRAFAGASVRLSDGRPAPIVGRICMDQCMIAIGDADVRPGDTVTVFGGDDGSMIEALARRGGTINYEIPCLLTPRIPRLAIGGDL